MTTRLSQPVKDLSTVVDDEGVPTLEGETTELKFKIAACKDCIGAGCPTCHNTGYKVHYFKVSKRAVKYHKRKIQESLALHQRGKNPDVTIRVSAATLWRFPWPWHIIKFFLAAFGFRLGYKFPGPDEFVERLAFCIGFQTCPVCEMKKRRLKAAGWTGLPALWWGWLMRKRHARNARRKFDGPSEGPRTTSP